MTDKLRYADSFLQIFGDYNILCQQAEGGLDVIIYRSGRRYCNAYA